jgi:uncharacterized membrane protein
MKLLSLLTAAALVSPLGTLSARAQSVRIVNLGATNMATAVWSDGVGTVHLAGVDTSGGGAVGTAWTLDAADHLIGTPLGLLPGGTLTSAVHFSDNGSYLLGQSNSPLLPPWDAIYWQTGAWATPLTYPHVGGYPDCAGYDISNSGRMVGNGGGVNYGPAVVADPGGVAALLKGIPGAGELATIAWGVSADNSLVVGEVAHSMGGALAVKWAYDSTTSSWGMTQLTDPYGIWSGATRATSDGSIIGGYISTPTNSMPCYWVGSTLTTLKDDLGADLKGGVGELTDGGSLFGSGQFGAATLAFIYHPSMGPNSMTLGQYYEQVVGSAPPSPLWQIGQVQETDLTYNLTAGGLDGNWYYLELPRADVAAFTGVPDELSIATGGTQTLTLKAGASRAGFVYMILGSTTGTAPGFPVDGLVLPVNVDSYFLYTLLTPNGPVLSNSLGVLDMNGEATATFNLPTGLSPSLAGITVFHAFAALSGTSGLVEFVSQAAQVNLAP